MPANGIAYVGDTAGVRVSGDYIKAPTPPPDIDIEAWQQSLQIDRGVAPVVAGPHALRQRRSGARSPRANCAVALDRTARLVQVHARIGRDG